MSSVESIFPMFGVSVVFFHGIGFRHIGMPSMMLRELPQPGPKLITSYFALRFGSFAIACVLRYVYGMPLKSSAWRHQPSVCVPCHVCITAIRAARIGCIFTEGAALTAETRRPRAFAAASRSDEETPR